MEKTASFAFCLHILNLQKQVAVIFELRLQRIKSYNFLFFRNNYSR